MRTPLDAELRMCSIAVVPQLDKMLMFVTVSQRKRINWREL
jgi:hypothetical protein